MAFSIAQFLGRKIEKNFSENPGKPALVKLDTRSLGFHKAVEEKEHFMKRKIVILKPSHPA